MADVDAWLTRLGLGQFAAVFRDSMIDAEVLPDLTDTDLKELGLPLGARKKILKAARALEAAEGSDLPLGLAEDPSAFAPTAAQAERRQLTVMFVDLVGSTALSAKLDPEDMGAVLRAYQNAVAGEITRFEGYVAKFMGDGVLAYFGWPVAHEDEPERAVRAGLAARDAIRRLRGGEAALACRIGIATGLVMVGELIGEGSASEQTVVGETPNLAARLLGVAKPGQIVVSEATRRLLGAGFALDDLGTPSLKGIDDSVGAFAVTGERLLASRFEGRQAGLQPMVGRDQELALLLERWEQAKASEGQAVLLIGEAGIGKSRITQALLDALSPEPHISIRYQCSPYHRDTALWPVVQQLSHAADIGAGGSEEEQLDKLEALLDRAAPAPGDIALVADLLGLDGSRRYGEQTLSPQAKRARTLQALTRHVVGLSRAQPVLLLIEDVHWIDPTSRELIELCLDATGTAPVLVVLTSRPEEQPPLAGYQHVTRLDLNRLGRISAEAIIARLSGKQLAAKTITTIVDRADGVPLFIEELTKAVVETGEAAIPASLHDSLMARLDRSPEVKEVAQIAACIGREFDFPLLAAVIDQPADELTAALDKLVTSELVFRRGTPPDASYSFKHALVRDAAHLSLLKPKRRALHERIAMTYEAQLPGISDPEPEVLAAHFTEAEQTETAVRYWAEAGQKAARRSANIEAIGHFDKALELVSGLPATKDRDKHELALRIAISGPLIATKGYPSAEVEMTFRRASILREKLGDVSKLFAILVGSFHNRFTHGEIHRAFELANELNSLDQAEWTLLRRVHIGRAMGPCLFYLGRLTEARDQLDSGLALERTVESLDEHHKHIEHHGEHPGVISRGYSAWTLWFLGYPDRALEVANDGVKIAKWLDHPFSTGVALGFLSFTRIWRREHGLAQLIAADTIETARENNLPMVLSWGNIAHGYALASLGQHSEGLKLFCAGLADWNGLGAHLMDTQWLGLLAEAKARARDFDRAVVTLERASAARKNTGEQHYLSEHSRVRAIVLKEIGQISDALASLQEAIDNARDLSAKSLELRATRDLAGILGECGERQRALDLLAPVYGWFTEGFETPDLIEAKALLDDLH